METKMIIQDVAVDQKTGHISISVRSKTTHESATWDGPLMVYGTDAISFLDRFNGDIEQVKTWIATRHAQYAGAHADLISKLCALKGQEIT